MKVYFVKSARKDNSVVKKGQSYYYWCPRHGGRRLSATYPKRSQLCQGKNAAFYSAIEVLEETAQAASDADDLTACRDECVSELESVRDEYQDSLYNMPEQLQSAPTGETMQEAIDAIESLISELESWEPEEREDEPEEFSEDEPQEDDFETEEEYESAHDEWEEKKNEAEQERADWESSGEEWISEQRDALVAIVQDHSFPY